MFCRECGSTLPEGGKFCHECGTKVEIENVPAYRCKKCNGKVFNLPEKPAKVCEFCGSKNLEPMTMEEFMNPVTEFNKKWSERFDLLS